jgi:hypothetical protein
MRNISFVYIDLCWYMSNWQHKLIQNILICGLKAKTQLLVFYFEGNMSAEFLRDLVCSCKGKSQCKKSCVCAEQNLAWTDLCSCHGICWRSAASEGGNLIRLASRPVASFTRSLLMLWWEDAKDFWPSLTLLAFPSWLVQHSRRGGHPYDPPGFTCWQKAQELGKQDRIIIKTSDTDVIFPSK